MPRPLPTCPQCGEPARGTIERLTGVAEFGDLGLWSGDTEIFWEEQHTERDEKTERPLLICRGGHDWPAPEGFEPGEGWAEDKAQPAEGV